MTNPDRERIVSGCRRSMETLDPLLRPPALTVEVIDQLVHRLYDLTDEAVRVVEEYLG